MQRPEDLVITTLAAANVGDYIVSASSVALCLYFGASEAWAEVWATLVGTPIVLVLGGILPKDLFQRESDRWMYVLATPLTWTTRALQVIGLIGLLRGIGRLLLRWIEPGRSLSEDVLLPRARVQRMLIEGAAAGGLSKFQRESLERVMDMSQLRVRNFMAPRERCAIVSIDMPRDDLLRIARMAHFSRLPVYRGDPRNVVGLINVYDVLMDDQPRPLRDYVRDILQVPPTETAATALLKLQQQRQIMAAVVDGWGRCQGIFTIKDLVRCVVGEIGSL
jgi:CBS domain containing-hemolysin-like protein